MKQNRVRTLSLAVLLLTVTALIYTPALRGGFLWDDEAYISRNSELTSLPGLGHIWFKPGSVQQYYPLTFTVFWAEYHVWGLHPLGYHLVNVFLHGMNALLVGIILEGLGLPGAWIAAWLFALHPVQAESVAWMTELKNVLSTFFYLLTLFFLLRSRRPEKSRPYAEGMALILFLCALLSKSITVTLPVSFLLITAWMTGAWDRKTVLKTVPLIGLSLGVGCFTLYFEHHLDGAQGIPWNFSFPQRLIIAGRAFWFYVGKLLVPSPLIFIYPRWSVNPHEAALYLYPVLAAAFLGLLAYGRRWWGKIPFACFLFFVVSLGPILGLTSFYFMRYSFVADHFQYLASIGLFALAGWLLTRLLNSLQVPTSSPVGFTVVFLVAFNLALATCRASRKYADPLHLWQETLRLNRYSAIANHNLGIALSEQGRWQEAVAYLRLAEAFDPSFSQTHLALAFFAVRAKRWPDARHEYEEAIRLGIRDPEVLADFAALSKETRTPPP